MKSNEVSNELLSDKAYATSLAPPRAPPVGTAHHSVLIGQDPSQRPWAQQQQQHGEEAHSAFPHDSLRQRLYQRIVKSHIDGPKTRFPHPHLAAGPELSDKITRFLGVWLPLQLQNGLRDSGGFRWICDSLVTLSAPLVAIKSPSSLPTFLTLSMRTETIRYGNHSSRRQVLDLFLPQHNDNNTNNAPVEKLLFFVHGGAWGSGLPWFYRLVAAPFLEQQYAVAIVGYRTWPDGNAKDQVDDCESAAACLLERYPTICKSVVMMGHSSGAHIGLLMLVERARMQLESLRDPAATLSPVLEHFKIDAFVGIGGPYDISHHFDYEAARGVEELSPMKPVCGYTRASFRENTPALQMQKILAQVHECELKSLDNVLPRMLLIHGIEDDTVPFTATAEAARVFRSCGFSKCDEIYVARTGHQDAILHVMLGGTMKDAIMKWLRQISNKNMNHSQIMLALRSKL